MQETFKRETNIRVGPVLPRPSLLNRKTMWGLAALAAILWSLAQTNFWQQEVVNSAPEAILISFNLLQLEKVRIDYTRDRILMISHLENAAKTG